MWNTGPSLVTMPAASWPRCCSSNRPSYKSWLTGVCVTAPTMPHIVLDSYSRGRLRFRPAWLAIIEVLRPWMRQPRLQTPRRQHQRRCQQCILPPNLLRQARPAGDEHTYDNNKYAACHADNSAEQPVEKAQPDRAHESV